MLDELQRFYVSVDDRRSCLVQWRIRSARSKLVVFSDEICLTSVLPELNTKIRELFDFDFPGSLDPVGKNLKGRE